jgi:hypothetical protein
MGAIVVFLFGNGPRRRTDKQTPGQDSAQYRSSATTISFLISGTTVSYGTSTV